MLLAIDAGNTNTGFAVHDGTDMRGRWRSVTKDVRTADEYGVWLIQLLDLQGLKTKDITGAVIATVAFVPTLFITTLVTTLILPASRAVFGIRPVPAFWIMTA